MILLADKPLVTDWMIATGALAGIPLAMWGIITLFIKDKKKERQLTDLEQMAISQVEIVKRMQGQIEQLILQTTEFQYQSYLMGESNKLLEKQLQLQVEQFTHGRQIEEQKLFIENQRRLMEIRPFLSIAGGSGSGPGYFHFGIENKSAEAKELKLVPIDTNFICPLYLNANQLNSGQIIQFNSSPDPTKTYYNPFDVPFEIEFQYEDIDGNDYRQRLKKFQNGRYKMNDPERIEA